MEEDDYQTLIDAALDAEPSEPNQAKEPVIPSIEQVERYVEWRAQDKPVDAAARLSGLTPSQARFVEEMEDFQDAVERVREEILSDPMTAFTNLVPQAVGILREEMQAGSVVAAREVIKIATIAGKRPKEQHDEVNGPRHDRPAGQSLESVARSVVSKRRGRKG